MKKSVKVLMIVSLSFVVVSALCMFLPALFIKDEAGHLIALDTLLVDCFRNFLTKFNFADPNFFTQGQPATFIYLGLVIIAIVIYLVWLIIIIAKKKTKSLIAFFLTLVGVVGIFLIADIYYFNPMAFTTSLETTEAFYGPFFTRFTIGGSEYALLAEGAPTNLIGILCSKSFGQFAIPGFPIALALVGIGSLVFAGVVYLLTIITAFADMADPKRVTKDYAVGESKDDNFEDEALVSTDELGDMIAEEKPVEEAKPAEEEKPAPVTTAIPQGSTVVINQYFGNNNVAAPSEPKEKPDYVTRDEVREIVKEEIEKANPLKAEDVRLIFREELERLFQPVEEEHPEEEPAPVAEPEPVVEEPAPVEEQPKPKIVRIPFTERLETISKEQRDHFNDLKGEIMAYGVKSRISNSGDTFRLHTKTYVKMVIAGKGLKLYLAIDPAKYEGSTIPFNNVGHKGIYKEIPFAFKVKSELSVRRAKELIAEAMASGKLIKGDVVNKDYVQEILDNKEAVEDDGVDESED